MQPTQGAGYNLLQNLEHLVHRHSRIRVRELFDKVPMTGSKEKEKQERPGNICKADELMLGIHFIRKVEGLAEGRYVTHSHKQRYGVTEADSR